MSRKNEIFFSFRNNDLQEKFAWNEIAILELAKRLIFDNYNQIFQNMR